jgi:Big-like domain-containing protein
MTRRLLTVLMASGCGGGGPSTAIRIELVPNASINSRQEVYAALDGLEIVVDGTEHALLGLNRPGPVGPHSVAADPDMDGDLELVFTIGLDGTSDLPVLQFEPGENGDQALLFRLHGLDAAGDVAATGQVAVAFQADRIVLAQAPFNLKAEYRVPRVVAVLPDLDAIDVPCGVTLSVTFSEAMDAATTRAAFTLRAPSGRVDGDTVMEDGDTQLRFHPAATLPAGVYSIEVGTGAQDEQGESLDQDPYADGAQGFVSQFTVAICP